MQAIRSLLFAAVAGFAIAPSVASAAPAGIPTDGTVADTAERVVDSVVTISTSEKMRLTPEQQFFMQNMGGDERDRTQQAQGSGVSVTANGRVRTNAHVVNGADTIKVTLPGGQEVQAKVVGKDVNADLAVLQLQGKLPPLKPITFGDSSALRLGDIVLAVGNGLGVGKSVSMGIISAKGLVNLGIEEYEDFLQTDATINPCNSGGALVNLKCELVGINTAIASRSGGSQGIGTVTPEVLKEHKLGASEGVVVGGIQPGGPAARTGLEMGDVVTAVGDKLVKTDTALRTRIAETKPGTVVDLDVVHQDGRKAVVKVKLGELPEETSQLVRRRR